MPRLDLGREIVSLVLRTKDTKPFTDAGMTFAWVESNTDLEHAVVFPGQDRDAWSFLLAHEAKHGNVPGTDLFEVQFPQTSYPLPDSQHTPAELLELAGGLLKDYRSQDGLDEAQALVDAGDYDAAADVMRAAADRVQAGPGGPSPFRVLGLDDLDNLPDPEPLIDGVLDHGTVTMLAGASGSGKSFLALDWALSIASGRAWHGRKVRRGKVLYLAAEGAYGMKQRVRAWREQYGPAGDFDLIPDAVQLSEELPLAQLIQVARGYQFIIIDTLARTSAGLEENSARDMGKYVNALYKIRDALREAGASVLVVHHTGYDKSRARGSSAIHANVDNVLALAAPDDPHQYMEMKFAKRKDGPKDAVFALQLVTAGPSCYIVELEQPPAAAQSSEDKILAVLTDDPMSQQDIAAATGLSGGGVSQAVNKLVRVGAVVKDGGRPIMYRPA